MPSQPGLQFWDVWYPQAGATGIPIGRALVESTEIMLLHAAGEVVSVEVRDTDGQRLAFGADLARTLESPICRLRMDGSRITREDIWPAEPEIGSLVMLPGGEVGVLLEWWHADDRRAWRWRLEFSNHID